jgi:hypothetical protein
MGHSAENRSLNFANLLAFFARTTLPGPCFSPFDGELVPSPVRAPLLERCFPTGAETYALPNRKISLKNRKIIGRLGLRGFQPEMSGAASASFDKQFPFNQIEEVSVRRQRKARKTCQPQGKKGFEFAKWRKAAVHISAKVGP